MNTPTKSRSQLTALAIPVVLAGLVWIAPGAVAASDSAHHREQAVGLGGKLPNNIDLSELETRSLERFSELDSNNNGLIDAQEYASGAKMRGKKHRRGHRGMRRHASRGENAETKAARKTELFARLDTNNNGELSSEEFGEARATRRELRKEQHLQKRFARMDENGDAQLSLEEFQQRLEKIRALDNDADGTVTREELRRGIKERRSAHRQVQRNTESQG